MMLMAGFVPQHVAEQVAINFFISLDQTTEPEIHIVDVKGYWSSLPMPQKGDVRPTFYIFDIISSKGFVIISADDCVIPILGYSLSSNYSGSDMPPALIKWLDDLRKQVNYVVEMGEAPGEDISRLWDRYLGETPVKERIKSAVSPLLTTTWNQKPYYNDLCPGGSVSGCVATAMTQIMKYWNYPEQGFGFHSYNHATYGTLSANFGGEQYRWSLMPNNLNSSNEAVATLTYHAGVAVEMNYTPQSSGAYVISSHSPIEHCAEYALKNYFGYNQNTLQGIARESYTNSQWMNTIKGELDAGRPVLYAGFGNGGGHAFVCDGYDNFNYLHINWGWGGYYDGYFPVDALDPSGTGIGGGTGGYNAGHQAVIGIQPPDSGGGGGASDIDLRLYDNIYLSSNPISYGQSFNIHTDIVNYGPDNFSGDLCAAAFDQEGVFVDFIEIHYDQTLEGGYYYEDFYFSSDGLLSLLPGNYYFGIFYKEQYSNWILLDDGNYSNFISLTVEYSNYIELYSDIVVEGGTNITQNDAVTATVALANMGTTSFSGVFDISLYYMDGTLAQTIATTDPLNLQPNNYIEYSFSNNKVNLNPGTYFMAAMIKRSSSNWELAGSTYYTNPIKIIVIEAEIPSDPYENNDSWNEAFSFTPRYNNNHANVTTPGANSHNGTDIDYYSIFMEQGYDYTLTARAHDSYNSGNGQQYSNDVLWSYYTGDDWSNAYDDICDENIFIQDGGTFYVLVAPYFEGETGTYLLDIQISREPTGINEKEILNITIHPNPVQSTLYFSSTSITDIQKIEVISLAGLNIPITEPDPLQTGIDVSNLSPGMYILRITRGDKILCTKFIKQ